jgi:hypothetical protein
MTRCSTSLALAALLLAAAGCPASPSEPFPRDARPSKREAARVAKAVELLARAWCEPDRDAFMGRVAPLYELGWGTLFAAHAAAQREREGQALEVRLSCVRSLGATVDVGLDWKLRYTVRATGSSVEESGTSHLALERRGCMRLLSQKGTLLFGS